jgi:hypothetical protein
MKILLHICCAPCAIYPLRVLREQGYEVCGLFYNPNIHPYQEYRRRREALEQFAEQEELRILWTEDYPLEAFLRQVAFREESRCGHCYELRLTRAAEVARQEGVTAFTTTLLYSRFQNHALIAQSGRLAAGTKGVDFLYRDFRAGWHEGIRVSRERGIYRQAYCGCIYSEKDRYCRPEKAKMTAAPVASDPWRL